ncbi:MAG TPA: L-type lectin-domain containing protein [Polyangia bacterium]|jgi:hypothetical protein|nr:L-type lectin-domain containing protein [Polyangia bacterium]
MLRLNKGIFSACRFASALLLAAALLPGTARAASDVCYAGGPILANFKLNGNAHLDGTSIVITDPVGNESGSVMYQTQLSGAANFHIKMQVQITTPANTDAPADGMAFVMHNAVAGTGALGIVGEGIGYGGIAPSVVVEFDTFRNLPWDPAGPHIAITRAGEYRHNNATNAGLPAPVLFSSLSPAVNPVAGTPFFIWIDYTAAATRLDVFVSATDSKPAAAALSTAIINLAAVLGANFFVGFTGSTGGEWSKHEFLQLYATDNGTQANSGCCNVDADCAASAAGPICDPNKKVCGTCSFNNTTGCPTGDKACNLSTGHAVCTVPCDGSFGAGTPAACPSAIFPFCRTSGVGAGSCAACSGDAGTAGSAACPPGAPFCSNTGYCGLCTSNADCTSVGATHAGGFCSSTGVCVTNCAVDADCGPGNACVAGKCVAKAANPLPIPGGTCSAPLAVRYCVSAVCSPSNKTCGFVDGLGPCTTANAATVCQSAVCSQGNVCIPASSGACYVDADCAAGFFCDRNTLMCQAKLANGQPIASGDGLHDGMCTMPNAVAICASGLCNATTKTCGGLNGVTCTGNGDCEFNVCAANHICGAVNGTPGCTPTTAASFCQSGTCSNGICVPGGVGSCLADSDCDSTHFCKRDIFLCTPRLLSGEPIPSDGLHDGTCTDANATATCSSGFCNKTTNTCGDVIRTACTNAKSCADNICDTNMKCGYANGNGPCTATNAVDVCQSSVCGPQSKVCIPSDAGGCGTDADCASTSYCDGTLLHCTPKLAAGTSLPMDMVHAMCTAGANAACVSGLCNTTTKTCGGPNGTACVTANQCVVNICGNNMKCGLNDGQSGCTTATATLCQSGMCNASAGVCGAQGCTKDSDCPATSFCRGDAGLCQIKLANGQAIPSDGIHDGACTVAEGVAVCMSGLCNVANSQCAAPLGGACTMAGNCADNICGGNMKCGRDAGEGPCDLPSQVIVCQSGVCNAATMRCQPTGAGGCTSDADCAATQFCQRKMLMCLPKLNPGDSIPNDGLHDGTCAAAPAVCASAMCNQVLTVCGSPNGDGCTGATTCASNICFDDSLCGKPDGLSCATIADCRSASCTDGVCGPGPATHSLGGSGGCGFGGGQPNQRSGVSFTLTALLVGLVARLRQRRG